MKNQDLPKRHRPVIRVFVSSTFADLKHERNALQVNVWPALERYCQQRGFQFQAIDLRWGVPAEAGLDHRTMRICFEELRRSQTTSPRPNFLILLGDRYGWRPLPEEISTDEYSKLADQISPESGNSVKDSASLAVLEAWYPLDSNTVPPVHVLRSRRNSPDGHDFTDPKIWNKVEEVLWSIINRAFPPDRLAARFEQTTETEEFSGNVPSIVRFQTSATEQEIWHGAFQVIEAPQHVFAFVRKIQNLDESVQLAISDPHLKDFVDLTPDGGLDPAADSAQKALQKALHERLGVNYCEITTTARLHFPSDRNALDVTTEHLDALCAEVRVRLEQVIDREIDDYRQGTTPPGEQQPASGSSSSSPPSAIVSISRELELEILEHIRFGRERAPQQGFVGRSTQIRKLQDYLTTEDRQPLVVSGPSGSGKTAFLARVALPDVTLPGESIPPGTPLTILRFLGTTPATSAVRPLLTSLCRELREYFPLETELPGDFIELTDEFHNQLARANPERPIHLFLDALDQLDDTDAGRQLGWLRVSPSHSLPQHVKLVVSCLSDADDDPAGGPIRRLSHSQLLDKGIALEELSPDEAVSLLCDNWLNPAQEPHDPITDPFGRPRRTLTTEQRDVIEQHIRRPGARECRRPLYLKILFEEARLWRSSDPVPPLGDSVHALLQSLFRRLRRRDQHGCIVRPVLSYLVAARHGLTENEILEILFADPGYKTHLDQFNAATGHQFPTGAKRIPIVLWARFRHDLAPYLAERAAPGGTVLNFYHRQVGKFVRQWLLDDRPAASYYRQRRLARYWLRQPWWLESREKQRARMQPPYSARPAHLRKATELPESLVAMASRAREAGLTSETESAYRHIEKLFQRLEFPEAKNEGGLIFELPGDFRQAVDVLPKDRPQRRIPELIEIALRRDIHFIHRHHQDYPQALFQCLWNTCWWYDNPLSVEYFDNEDCSWPSEGPPWARSWPKLFRLLERFRQSKERHSPGFRWLRGLRPPDVMLGRRQRLVFSGHTDSVTALDTIPGAKRLVSASTDGSIRIWNLITGQEVRCIRQHSGEVSAVVVTPNGQWILSGSHDGSVRVWDAESGECIRVLFQSTDDHPFRRQITCVAVSPDGQMIAAGSANHAVYRWSVMDWTPQPELSVPFSVQCLSYSADGQYLCSGTTGETYVWEAASGRYLFRQSGLKGEIKAIAVGSDGVIATAGGNQIDASAHVWSVRNGRPLGWCSGHRGEITAMLFDPDSNRLITGSMDRTVRIWDSRRSTLLDLMHLPAPPTCLTFCSETRSLVCGTADGVIREFSILNELTEPEADGHRAMISSVCFSPDGSLLASTAMEPVVRIWNGRNGTPVLRLLGHEGESAEARFAPDNRLLLTRQLLGGNLFRLWDAARGEALSRLNLPNELTIHSFSADDWYLIGAVDAADCIDHSEESLSRNDDTPAGAPALPIGWWTLDAFTGTPVDFSPVRPPNCPVIHAIGETRRPFRASVGDQETSIQDVQGRTVAWFPVVPCQFGQPAWNTPEPPRRIFAEHCQFGQPAAWNAPEHGTIWAAGAGPYLVMFCLEGEGREELPAGPNSTPEEYEMPVEWLQRLPAEKLIIARYGAGQIETVLEQLRHDSLTVRLSAMNSLTGVPLTRRHAQEARSLLPRLFEQAVADENFDHSHWISLVMFTCSLREADPGETLLRLYSASPPSKRRLMLHWLSISGVFAKVIIPELVGELTSGTHDRHALLRALSHIGIDATTPIATLCEIVELTWDTRSEYRLQNVILSLRGDAWNALGQLAEDEDVSALLPYLSVIDHGVHQAFPEHRRNAAQILGRIGTAAEKSVSTLKNALKSDDGDLRRISAWALSQIIPSEQDIWGYVAYLSLQQPQHRLSAAGYFAESGRDASPALPVLTRIVRSDEDYSVRYYAAQALGNVSAEAAPIASDALIAALQDDNPHVRQAAESAMSRLQKLLSPPDSHPSANPSQINTVERDADDSDPDLVRFEEDMTASAEAADSDADFGDDLVVADDWLTDDDTSESDIAQTPTSTTTNSDIGPSVKFVELRYFAARIISIGTVLTAFGTFLIVSVWPWGLMPGILTAIPGVILVAVGAAYSAGGIRLAECPHCGSVSSYFRGTLVCPACRRQVRRRL